MTGWIKLHRSIRNHWIFEEKRKFSKFEAWVDLILLANHRENTFVLGNEVIKCERGMHITSKRQLGRRWNWSSTKVGNYLELLRKDEMISYISDSKKTIISIENYNIYQDEKNTEKNEKEIKSQIKENQKQTNKNVKNVKNEEEIYIDVIEYMNQETRKNFSYKTKLTRKKIDERLEEGYALDDFKKVIKNKTSTWLDDEKMNRYLRPETLFGYNFESYLNESLVEEMNISNNPYAHLEIY